MSKLCSKPPMLKKTITNFLQPYSVATHGESFFISHGGFNGYTIAYFTKDADTRKDFGPKGTGTEQLNHPVGMLVYNDTLLVADHNLGKIKVFSLMGHFKRSYACLLYTSPSPRD